MKKTDNWTNELRIRLEEHQETPPEGLWEDIANNLASADVHSESQNDKEHHMVNIFSIKPWLVAAAIAATLIGGIVLYWHAYQMNDDRSKTVTAKDNTFQPENIHPQTEEIQPHYAEEPQNITVSNKNPYVAYTEHISSKNPITMSEPSSQHIEESHTESSFNDSQDVHQDHVVEDNMTETSKNEDQSHPIVTDTQPDSNKTGITSAPVPSVSEQKIITSLDHDIATRHYKERELAFSLYASNGMEDMQDKSMVYINSMANYSALSFNTNSQQVMRIAALHDYYEKKHHFQPVSFGLSGKIGICERWALNTGLVYSIVRSDFATNMGSSTIDRKQTLHYLGVPLSMMYRIWRSGGFSTYLSMGGEVDFNVASYMSIDGDRQKIDHDRPQWSAMVSVGAQYDFTRQIGLYIEPGAKYYFDNGSPLDNIFKDKQFNYNILLGLRFNVE